VFAEALRQEEAKNFPAALAKFREVQAIKDTAPIRYRIARCLAGVGRLREAEALYRNLLKPPVASSSEDAELEKAGRAEADALATRIPTLSVLPPPGGTLDPTLEVSLDGAALDMRSMPWRVDPGEHTITMRQGAQVSTSRLTLTEGSRSELNAPPVAKSAPAAESKAVAGKPNGGTQRTVGYIAGGAGLAFGIAAIATLAMRESAISDLETACPGGVCPASRRQELESTRDRASALGPVTAVLGGLAVVGLGTGVTLVLTAPSPTRAANGSNAWNTGVMISGRWP
jgi:hypothetical protein